METRYIDPVRDMGPLLLNVEKPARYTGGEYGRLCKPRYAQKDSDLKTVIAFPDLYEIGMSNQALRILYNRLNAIEGVFCDRAFAPAPDFEELLRNNAFPLYGLDTGISLKHLDLLMFTFGYELGITNVFSMLDISGIPLRSSGRGEDDPLVIMGGPCVSNPLPYSVYIDGFWIGEAEGGFFDLVKELAEMKKNGAKRQALFDHLVSHPSIWTRGKGRAVRAIDRDFSVKKNPPAVFPVPSMKVVHQHGAVEIMRGCPNGCRFCHAGYWYRPMRQKSADNVEAETEAFVRLGGYREISLSSLSSGDYQHLDSLIDSLNGKFQGQRISFQLPSLRVSSFSLNLLEKISEVRKSGLTFAVETPADFWQMAINKEVSGEDIVSILREAKRRGWRGAKFYFMIGLPLEGSRPFGNDANAQLEFKSEEEEIAAFIERTAKQTGMHFNINVGTFVPKPHTPFQWAVQLGREEAEKKLNYLCARLRPQGHKVGIQAPLVSVIEGIASRGDERAGDIFEDAYLAGCRLDSWTDFFKKDIWENLLQKYNSYIDKILKIRDIDVPLPWSCVSSGINEQYFARELTKSKAGELTSPCINNCKNPCAICGSSSTIVQNSMHGKVNQQTTPGKNQSITNPVFSKKPPDPDTYRIIFSFAKQGSAVFQPHLGLIEIFSMAFIRANIPVLYSQGFNPLPKLDIASPLSLGIRARGEIAAIDTEVFFEAAKFKAELNVFLPEGLEIGDAINVKIPSGSKKYSVSSLLWGFTYTGKENNSVDLVAAREEKEYRLSRIDRKSVFDLERFSVLAKTPETNDNMAKNGNSYFEVFKALYPDK